jgi:hypothetical protein
MATQTRLAPDPIVHPMHEMFGDVRHQQQPVYPPKPHIQQQVANEYQDYVLLIHSHSRQDFLFFCVIVIEVSM